MSFFLTPDTSPEYLDLFNFSNQEGSVPSSGWLTGRMIKELLLNRYHGIKFADSGNEAFLKAME